MKRSIGILLLVCLAASVSGQKSKVLAAIQMIETEKFSEAKENIELAVGNEKTSRWHRTYYTKGLLCQSAYEAGVKKEDQKLITLYPDQLFLAYDSYEMALKLDARERLKNTIKQKYYLLSNDFRALGEELYQKKEFGESLRAFENALLIMKSDLISAKTDTNLVYNTALAAYESQNWEKVIAYLSGLHEDAYSSTSSHLLSFAYLNSGDTLRSEEVIIEGLEMYHYDESLLMYLINYLSKDNRNASAIEILDRAIETCPENFRFLWARGLVYQKMEINDKAIENFLLAAEHSSDEAELYYHLGVSYSNIGIELRESARRITKNNIYKEVREQYLDKFREAVKWLERSYKLDPHKKETASALSQLYSQLQMKEELENMKQLAY
jgi:tetratricopeptide (TPR) repeat protein